MTRDTVRLRLPATSANLGPGFDAVGLALDFHLEVEASAAAVTVLQVTGRDAARIAAENDNLVLATYRDVLTTHGIEPVPLALSMHNEIPLGMGCGSSAAALVAGVALANAFGALSWNSHEMMEEAARREGHPDNVAACVLGGFTVSAMRHDHVDAIALQPAVPWQLLLVIPEKGLATKTARGILPDTYSRADAVTNVQNAALLTAAFVSGNSDLLGAAMHDRLHQPYRASVCPLLPLLLPVAGHSGVLGVALSGAGPSVLLIVQPSARRADVEQIIHAALATEMSSVDLLWTTTATRANLGDRTGYPSS